MEVKNRNIFWEALILAVFIFASGILLGYFLEMNRTSKIISVYQQIELDLLDTKVQDSIISLNNIDCDKFFEETLLFADRIYNEARILEQYDDSSQLSKSLILQHKKYDLLRAELWVNSVKLKEKCSENFSTLVYFYEYKTESLEVKSRQEIFSNKLSELKDSKGSSLILIPIAGNMEINSIEYLKATYNITSYPSILIDEKIKINSIEGLNKIESYLK